MVSSSERILLIGDTQNELRPALESALPAAQLVLVPTVFDGLAELVSSFYSTVIVSAEPIERRPESAVKRLREVAGQSRLLLFGHPTLEPLSRKMLQFGVDDYLVTPTSSVDLNKIFTKPTLKIAESTAPAEARTTEPLAASPTSRLSQLLGVSMAEILVDALLAHPGDALQRAIAQLNARLAPSMKLTYQSKPADPPAISEGSILITLPLKTGDGDPGAIHFVLPREEDETAGRHFLSQVIALLGKVATIQERHNALQKLAITDELTGLHNGRYFKHFLSRIIEKSRAMRFPVTLLLFDIDNFKQYNDQFGHGVGDEILKQTALLMRKCVRDHDLVARISGDEFAVVFWEKDGPRQPRDSRTGQPLPVASRPPQTPVQIFERFQKMIASHAFNGLGPQGRGTLTISGGLAVFPYDAHDVPTLIEAADKALMFGAKQSGKNSIFLIGGSDFPTE